MDPWLLIALLGLAAARLTRLLVADSFPPIAVTRARVQDRWGAASWQVYLANCPWCMGVWVAAVVTAVATAWYGCPAPVLVWLAVSWVAGFLTYIETHIQPEDDS